MTQTPEKKVQTTPALQPQPVKPTTSLTRPKDSTEIIKDQQSRTKAFTLKCLVDSSLESKIPTDYREKSYFWTFNNDVTCVIKREDFLILPDEFFLRISKEHTKITGRKSHLGVSFEIQDLSVNGIFLLGNTVDGTFGKVRASRIKKSVPYRIRDGDVIGLLMKKDLPHESVIAFELIVEGRRNNEG